METITIGTATFDIEGTGPLLVNAWTDEVKDLILNRRGPRLRSPDRRPPRYVSHDGWDGMPTGAFKSSMIYAGTLLGHTDRILKRALRVCPDGECATLAGAQLVRLNGDWEPVPRVITFEDGRFLYDLLVRYSSWSASLRVEFNSAQVTAEEVANLVATAGSVYGLPRVVNERGQRTNENGRWVIKERR